MNKYQTYKPSGIEWIGEIPAHWEVKRLKNITQINYGDTLIEEDRIDGEVPVYGSNGITGSNDKPNTKAPCIIVGRKGSFGKVNFSDIECFAIDTTFYIDATASSQNLKWLFYVLDNIGLDKLSKDTGVPGLNREDAYRERLPFPSLLEQLTIVNYLDSQTQKIDNLIANKKVQVERLKELRQIEINNAVTKGLNPNVPMKDSGIEWLGEIPEHWEVNRLKNVTKQVSEKSSDITNDDFIIALENIESNTGRYIETSSEYESSGIYFTEGHLLYNKLRPYLCKVYQAERSGICVGDIIVIECSNKLYSHFLQFRLLSDAFTSVVISSTYGAKMPRTSWEFISNLKFGVPPIDEQMLIVEYLQQRTSTIDKLIKNTELQILKLQELRKIKIYEAVTGKLRIEN